MSLGAKHTVTSYIEIQQLQRNRIVGEVVMDRNLFLRYLSGLRCPLRYFTEDESPGIDAACIVSLPYEDGTLEDARALEDENRVIRSNTAADRASQSSIVEWTDLYVKTMVEADVEYTEHGIRPQVVFIFAIERK